MHIIPCIRHAIRISNIQFIVICFRIYLLIKYNLKNVTWFKRVELPQLLWFSHSIKDSGESTIPFYYYVFFLLLSSFLFKFPRAHWKTRHWNLANQITHRAIKPWHCNVTVPFYWLCKPKHRCVLFVLREKNHLLYFMTTDIFIHHQHVAKWEPRRKKARVGELQYT